MVRGMVDRLAARLKEDGSDLAGWERLLRSYKALGDADKAKAAAAEARQALGGDEQKLSRINALIRQLGLES
jgi:cytochrome c-type biogenesis protein CcmH